MTDNACPVSGLWRETWPYCMGLRRSSMDNRITITITFDPADLECLLGKAKFQHTLHSVHCPFYTWYGGGCSCWQLDARQALAEHQAKTEGGK